MNRFAKTVMFALLLSVIPARTWAQEIRDYENGFLFNVFRIENVEERVQLASALATSDIWLCNPTDNPGELFIRPNSYNADIPIYAEFDYLRMTLREEYEEASALSKEEFAEVFNSWARNISDEYYNFLISDHLDRANHCMDAEPFCTSDVYNFPANNSGYSWSGPNYGCLGTSPTNKHSFWYYMRIGVAGNITIKMEAPFDIDFALWGPFSNEIDPCPTAAGQTGLLTANCSSCPNNTSNPNFYPSGNLHDCSFSAQAYEYAHVVNGQVGQYYILLITNYNGGSGNITFQKYAGDGETDCGILPPLVDNDGPYCVGETIHLTANGQAGATYSWTGPGGFSSTQQNPTRPNCTMNMAGTYTCTITVGSQTNSATTDVVIYPQPTANFNFTTVCQGDPTQFTSTSTTNPSGQNITSYLWDFGDGQTSTQQNPSHTYATANTYNVTLTVGCGNGLCTNQITKSVTVYAAPVANAGPDQTIGYGGSAQLSGSGGAGTFNFHWEPANMVVNPNAQNTQTVALTQDQTYTLTVTNAQGGCSSTDQVTIHISGSAMTVSATASPNSICEGAFTQLQANAGGGTGNFTYSWTPTTGLSNPNIYNPIANPTQTTTYTCHVTDGQTAQDVSVTVTVNQPEYTEETHYICPDSELEWNGQVYTDEDDYQYVTTTPEGCEKIITLHLRHYPTYDETPIEAAICYGETYDFFGTQFNSSVSGYPHTLQTHDHGCDSIVRLNLTVYPDNGITENEVTICPEQQPYYYEGDPSSPVGEGIHLFFLEDIHGCDSLVQLTLNVNSYFKPEVQTKHVCELPYQWVIPEADTTIVVYEEGFYTDTLSTSACDGIFRLDLHFQQVPEVEHLYITACDSYDWWVEGMKVGTYMQDCEPTYSIPLDPFPCERVYQLHLTINTQDLLPNQSFYNECDAVHSQWPWPDTTFYENTVYTFTGETEDGCYREQTYIIENMQYTPAPVIKCSDQNVEWPHHPITATEFNVNRYTYYASDPRSDATWNNSQCEWSISKPSWRIQPSADNRSCEIYAMDWVEDTIWLTFKAVNPCSGDGIVARYWLKPSFYGIEELDAYPASVEVFPNPNNGQMELRFENMGGHLSIRVFSLTGTLVDSFELKSVQTGDTYPYAMRQLQNGVYFFSISDGKRNVTKKVVIIH